jgi:predicted RNase H-like nuclease (RuvC/YqgF family)
MTEQLAISQSIENDHLFKTEENNRVTADISMMKAKF